MIEAAFIAAALTAAGAVVYFQLRHAWLAALTVAGPVPGLAAGWWTASQWTSAGIEFAPVAYVIGLVLAQTIALRIERGVCDGIEARSAVRRACGGVARAAGPALAVSLLSIAVFALDARTSARCGAAEFLVLAVSASVFAATPLAILLPYTENFVARANRQRELLERLSDAMSGVTQTRWAFSVSGIALVFAALAGFGMRGLRVDPEYFRAILIVLAAAASLVSAASLVVARDWRLAVAMLLTQGLVAALALWAVARGGHVLSADMTIRFAVVLSAVTIPAMLVAFVAGQGLRARDDVAAALAHALRQNWSGGGFAALAAALLLFAAILPLQGPAWPVVMAAASLVATPLVFPAFATALHALLPRYRTVEEVFGRK